jgi:hypothetical protein
MDKFPFNIVAGQTIQITFNGTTGSAVAIRTAHIKTFEEYLVLFYQSRWSSHG